MSRATVSLFAFAVRRGRSAATLLAVAACLAVLVAPTPAAARPKGIVRTLPPRALQPKIGALYPPLEIEWKATFADHVGIVGVHYLTEAERESARIVVQRGLVYTSSGSLFPDYPASDLLIYVMDPAGNFYVGNQTRDPKLHHSSFFAGKAVAAAGEIRISNGTITMINRSSGHYKPALEVFQRVLAELRRDGVSIEPLRAGGIR